MTMLLASLFAAVLQLSSSTVTNSLRSPCSSSRRTICHCGESGIPFSLPCTPDNSTNEICAAFRFCRTCKDGLFQCLSCPPGRFGALCSEGIPEAFRSTKHYAEDLEHRNLVLSRNVRATNCPDLAGPKSGSIRCWFNRDSRECTGTCLPGYRFQNSEAEEIVLKCSRRGWQPRSSFPPCVSQGFCDLEMTGAGSYNCTAGVQGTRCDVRCTGRPPVNRRFFCYPGQPWDPPLPHCVRRKGSQATYDCNCQNGGVCDTETGDCACPDDYAGRYCENYVQPAIVFCPEPIQIRNGYIVRSGGEELENPARQSYPTSRQSYLQNRPPSSAFRQYPEGSTVVYSCNTGYVLAGESLLRCESSGRWSSPFPTCRRYVPPPPPEPPKPKEVTCEDPGFVTNGQRHTGSGQPSRSRMTFTAGQTVVYSCNEGFALRRSSILTCLRSGQWSGRLPECVSIRPVRITTTTTTTTTESPEEEVVYCKDPGVDPNGKRDVLLWLNPRTRTRSTPPSQEEFPEGVRMKFSCKEGYSLQGMNTLTCLFTGEWSHTRPTCQLDSRSGSDGIAYCEDPGFIPDGDRTVIYPLNERRRRPADTDDTKYPVNVKIVYSCKDGFDLEGESNLTCTSSGTWSGSLPECRPGCGRTLFGDATRVIRGERTTAGQWPWHVGIAAIRRGRPEIVCGASLISRRAVVTAAHCVNGQQQDRLQLYFAKLYYSMDKDGSNVVVRKPSSIIMHPNYNPATDDADIAIIRFSPDVKIGGRIYPICLPTRETTKRNLVQGRKGWVTGWGLTEDDLHPEVLMMARIPYQATSACTQAYREQKLEFPITSNMFCAGYEEGRIDSCTGDSGGPFVFYDTESKRFILEGIVSFGVEGGCAIPKRYSVYTKVSNYVPWIRKNA